MNRLTGIGVLLVALLHSGCAHDELPTCGSVAVTSQVQRIVADTAVKNLPKERADVVRQSITWTLDSIEKGELTADGHVRKCSAQLAAKNTTREPLAGWTPRTLHYEVRALEDSSKFLVQVLDDALPPNGFGNAGSSVSSPVSDSAQREQAEEDAIRMLSAINSGQATFRAACANGFYAPSLRVLAVPPTGSDIGFIWAIETSGYHVELTKDDGAVAVSGDATCNGFPSGTAVANYKATASPVNEGPGWRYFMTDSRDIILVSASKAGPWEPVQ